MCADSDDPFNMRPPLWEDITSSIQNIDPENAIMLGSMATQVKLETSSSTEDVHMLEPLSSPLLSPLEIKTEKSATTTATTLISNQHSTNHPTMTSLNHLQPPPPLQHLQHTTQIQLHHMASSNAGAGEAVYHPNGSYQPAHHILNGFLSGGTNGSGLHQYSNHQHQPQQNAMSIGDNSSYYGSPVNWSGHTQVRMLTKTLKCIKNN